ncbi:SAM-dependent methyltransferase [Qipengyuania sp. 6B39]|uniref:class I SAM-dependent methyltransferase n=1 Tax=Qipengyuania proteolytica TaxID=2867239 RepID=UPI001C8AA4BC|nr:SAM-dependent methyltransferase [Qipengyuania proteolytica]MBX7494846.1 SAM-dependent methyltransferase [Qipengyuania proteolytica]
MNGGGATTLADSFRRLIERHGPIPVARYMGESNARYYSSRDPLGADGDFTTAPEISQMFGEMVGLWLADVWVRAGRPAGAIYVELGPGRGTLAQDALRAMASQGLRPDVHLVEGSEALRRLQSGALAGAQFHDSLDTLPEDRPLLLAANEFIDALPIRQLVMTDRGWRERMVALDEEGAFAFAAGPNAMDDAVPEAQRAAEPGTVIETCPAAAALVGALAERLDRQGGAALFVDYGHLAARTGSTLQAVRAHEKVGVFDAPGEMDLTAHVDFATLVAISKQAGLATATATQGAWLSAMGIALRAQALVTRSPERAKDVADAHDRLVQPQAMGELFKVLAMTPRDWPRGAGFDEGPAR